MQQVAAPAQYLVDWNLAQAVSIEDGCLIQAIEPGNRQPVKVRKMRSFKSLKKHPLLDFLLRVGEQPNIMAYRAYLKPFHDLNMYQHPATMYFH